MDAALLEMFRAESAERFEQLDHDLLLLEKAPGDRALLEGAFREAHSLKGAARMLGLASMQAIAHRLEDELNSARQGAPLGAESLARMSQQLGELRRLANQATSGENAAAPRVPPAPRVEVTVAAPVVAEPQVAATAGEQRFRIDSVRVDTAQLDKLMTHAGELAVTKTRVARRLADIEALIDVCEDWATKRASDAPSELLGRLSELRSAQAEDSRRLDYVSGELHDGIRIARLLPLSTVLSLFARPVRDLAREQGKEVELVIVGGETSADKRILEEIKDPLMHLIRNAIHHGIESPAERLAAGKSRVGWLAINVQRAANAIVVEVSDDGRGLDDASIRSVAAKRGFATEEQLAAMTQGQLHALLFASGFSTTSFVTDVSGRGVGLDVVRANVDRLKGSISVHTEPGRGTRFVMRLPTTVATVRVLVVELNGLPYGLPAEAVEESRAIRAADVISLNGRDAVLHRGQPVFVAKLATVLELPSVAKRVSEEDAACYCVFVAAGGKSVGLFVDALLDEQEVILKPQCKLLKRVRNVAGATILDSGELCMVLSVDDLVASTLRQAVRSVAARPAAAAQRRKAVLLAEDSIIIRTQETRILESAGYEVVAAVDGLDAWTKLAAREFDAVVSDINMPRLSGLELLERIRGERRFKALPVILVTSLASDDDRKRGLDLGANAYITKPAFDQQVLLDCLRRVV
jgi:two-component system chemotaxis sensor kinase CheA